MLNNLTDITNSEETVYERLAQVDSPCSKTYEDGEAGRKAWEEDVYQVVLSAIHRQGGRINGMSVETASILEETVALMRQALALHKMPFTFSGTLQELSPILATQFPDGRAFSLDNGYIIMVYVDPTLAAV